MKAKADLPQDLAGHASAVSRAIAMEDLHNAAALVTACTKKFTACQRTPDEVQHYLEWLRQTQASVRQCREHLSLRFSAVNASQYGRPTAEATWSIDA